MEELAALHAQPNGGIVVWARYWVHYSGYYGDPVLVCDLSDGGWSYTGSRQVAADVGGADDIVSIHEQQVVGGELIWDHLSDPSGRTLAQPTMLADLRTGGWDFRSSRETVGPFRVTL